MLKMSNAKRSQPVRWDGDSRPTGPGSLGSPTPYEPAELPPAFPAVDTPLSTCRGSDAWVLPRGSTEGTGETVLGNPYREVPSEGVPVSGTGIATF